MVATSRVVSLTNEVFPEDDIPDDSEVARDRDSYLGTAGWLIFLSCVCLLFQITMFVFRGLYFYQVLKVGFMVFAILVSSKLVIRLKSLTCNIACRAQSNAYLSQVIFQPILVYD